MDRHLRSCERCAAVVEDLADADGDPSAALGGPLAIALAPPEDLAERLESRVAAKLSSREVLNVVADLFGAGLETTRLLLTEDEHDDH